MKNEKVGEFEFGAELESGRTRAWEEKRR